ncbi:MAG: hypothetical protein OEW16_09560 [Gammaproteobacteria bacterium]|nr:hypothetical protein [Gammaproteobacteria bacterium]
MTLQVQDPPASVLDDEKTVQQLEGHGWHGEEVERSDHLTMVLEKGQPAFAGITPRPNSLEIAGHATFRFLTMLATGLSESQVFEQALPYTEKALALSKSSPDLGFEFAARNVRLEALIGLRRHDDAMEVATEALAKARESGRQAHEATLLVFVARIWRGRRDRAQAITVTETAVNIASAKGLSRILAEAHGLMAALNREMGWLDEAEEHAQLAASRTQESGELWKVPQRLAAVAELHVARRKFIEADHDYDRAEAFVDASIGRMTTAFEKAAVIRVSSESYT